MAKANISLLDLDDYSNKNLAASLIQPVSNKSCNSNAKSGTHPKQLKFLISGKRARKNELAFLLYAALNRKLRAVDVFIKDIIMMFLC